MVSRNTPENFWSRVWISGPGDCWIWRGGRHVDGYGWLRYHGRLYAAHRLAFMLTHGALPPPPLIIRHRCDNRPCCNPDHLEVGTHKQNAEDRELRGRGRPGGASRAPFHGLPPGPFGALLADPPWRFRTYDGKKSIASRGPDPYPSMALGEMCALPISDISAPDCALFMWAVDAHLEHALELGRAWGFTYKTIAFIWDKGRMGMGFWSRKEAEVCLLFTRGHPRRLDAGVRQIIRSPRREHSRKPPETHDLVSRLVGGPYLEMFSRETRPGWSHWGLEAGKFDP